MGLWSLREGGLVGARSLLYFEEKKVFERDVNLHTRYLTIGPILGRDNCSVSREKTYYFRTGNGNPCLCVVTEKSNRILFSEIYIK